MCGSTTLTVIESGGESASGSSIPFQTNISIVYNPVSLEVHDWAGERDCPGDKEPVNQDKEITT